MDTFAESVARTEGRYLLDRRCVEGSRLRLDDMGRAPDRCKKKSNPVEVWDGNMGFRDSDFCRVPFGTIEPPNKSKRTGANRWKKSGIPTIGSEMADGQQRMSYGKPPFIGYLRNRFLLFPCYSLSDPLFNPFRFPL